MAGPSGENGPQIAEPGYSKAAFLDTIPLCDYKARHGGGQIPPRQSVGRSL